MNSVCMHKSLHPCECTSRNRDSVRALPSGKPCLSTHRPIHSLHITKLHHSLMRVSTHTHEYTHKHITNSYTHTHLAYPHHSLEHVPTHSYTHTPCKITILYHLLVHTHTHTSCIKHSNRRGKSHISLTDKSSNHTLDL